MKYFYYYIFLFTILFISLSISFYVSSSTKIQEHFTPGIRQMYRPYVRSARVLSESFFQSSNNKVNNLLRKVGLY